MEYATEEERYLALRRLGQEAEAPDDFEPDDGEDGGFEEVGH